MAFVGFWMIPLMFILSIFTPFITFFENLTGAGKEEVALPYDPEKGIVWEYKKEDNDTFTDFLGSEIKDGQQIFTFRCKGLGDDDRPSGGESEEVIDDLCFVDSNGNIKKYYAFADFSSAADGGSFSYGSLDIYEASECLVFEYTVKASTEIENYFWYAEDYDYGGDDNRFVGKENLVNVHERTFEFVFPPEDIEDQIYTVWFTYSDSETTSWDQIEVDFEISDGEVSIAKETQLKLNNTLVY